MEQSLYFEYIQKYFPQLVLAIVEKLNDKKDNTLSYMFRQLLTPTYSVDGRWQTLEGLYTRVAADVVAMDSPLPLKKRDSLGKASGEIPKIGMELFLNEKQMSDIDALIAQGMDINTIVAKIFEDSPRVIAGIYERLEDMFLQGLSSGVAVAEGTENGGDNVGTGVRVDYGYIEDNQFQANEVWSLTTEAVTPIDDVEKVVRKAREDGYRITRAYMDKTALDNFNKSEQVRQQFAFNMGFVGTNIPVLNGDQANQVFQSRWGFPIEIVDRAIRTEANGVQTVKKPWQEGMVVFVTSTNLGGLVWTRLAEMNHPVSGVSYQTVDQYILVSKYRVNRPSLREYTTSQARVLPVIANPYGIYTLDTETKVSE